MSLRTTPIMQALLFSMVILAASACQAPIVAPQTTTAPQEEASTRLNVVSTVSPITNIVHNIGGDHINLAGIVPEGVNSHTFEPAPSDARTLAEADVIFLNGLHLEEPTLQLAEASKRDDAEIVELGNLTITEDEYIYDFSFPESAGSPNPHLWTNPIYALKYAEIVRDKLSELDPANAAAYAANYDAFAAQIDELDKAIQAAIDSIPPQNRQLLTYHDSWAYFSPRYGTTVIGAIQPADFSEPSAREVADLIVQLREIGVPAIFGSEVFPSAILSQIGAEAGVTYVDTLSDDDLPGEPGDADHSYVNMMVQNVQTMAAALGGDPTLLASVDTSNTAGGDGAVEQTQD